MFDKQRKMLNNKRGQISEGMSWIVATVVIIVILTISIFFTMSLDDERILKINGIDRLVEKSLFSYLSTPISEGGIVYDKLKTEENFTAFTGPLAVRVFNGLYDESYPAEVWLGILENKITNSVMNENNYFGKYAPRRSYNWDELLDSRAVNYISRKIKFEGEKHLELIMVDDYKLHISG